MLTTPQQLLSICHNLFCDECARDAEDNQMQKEGLIDKM